MSDPVVERFWAKVDRGRDGDCWEWLAYRNNEGYGRFRAVRAAGFAHRFAYELLVGPIPAGLVIDHLCRNRACVNPAHMEPVTDRENVLRGVGPSAIHAKATHCAQGHEFSQENTKYQANGWRYCRACYQFRNRVHNRVRVLCSGCGVSITRGVLARHRRDVHRVA